MALSADHHEAKTVMRCARKKCRKALNPKKGREKAQWMIQSVVDRWGPKQRQSRASGFFHNRTSIMRQL
jgi:hypothetical protein